MSCKICRRVSCASWMHPIEAQEALAERESMSDDVDALRREVQELRGEVLEANQRAEAIQESSQHYNDEVAERKRAGQRYRKT